MEVQAQCPPSTAAALFNPRKAPRLIGSGASPFFHTHDAVAQPSNLPGALLPQQQTFINRTTVFSGEPESELTCNASGSRKRVLVDGSVAHATLQHNRQQRTRLAHVPGDVAPPVKAAAAACVGTSSSFQASYGKIQLDASAMASTSGRPPAGAPVPAISQLTEEFVSQLYQQILEVDAFIRLQNERFRSGLEHTRKRHRRALLSAMEQGVLRHLREKEAELESASRRKAELEEKIKLLVSENQIWFNVARDNEAIASSLRATLEQVLLQNATPAIGPAAAAAAGAATSSALFQDGEKGCGEGDCVAPVLPADDAQSCCYEGASAGAEHDTAAARENLRELRLQSACKTCLKREVSVLLLPCRHLCLCKQCDSGVDACPVCNAVKNASLDVFMC